jgi:hypothetical protein
MLDDLLGSDSDSNESEEIKEQPKKDEITISESTLLQQVCNELLQQGQVSLVRLLIKEHSEHS